MKNLKFSRLFAAVTFVAILALAGCKQPDTSTLASLYGTWVEASTYGNAYYKITSTTFENYGDTYESYAGNALTVVEDTEDSGRIFIKYTKSYESTNTKPTGDDADTWTYSPANPAWGTAESWYRYSTTAPDVGKWYAISYKDLTANSINISGAAGTKTSCDTLEEAKTEFTVDNGYFSYYSSCAKQ